MADQVIDGRYGTDQSIQEKQMERFDKVSDNMKPLSDEQKQEGSQFQQAFDFNGSTVTAFGLNRLTVGSEEDKRQAADAGNKAIEARKEFYEGPAGQRGEKPNHDEALAQSPMYQGLKQNEKNAEKEYGKNSQQYQQVAASAKIAGALVEQKNGTANAKEEKLIRDVSNSSPQAKQSLDQLAGIVGQEDISKNMEKSGPSLKQTAVEMGPRIDDPSIKPLSTGSVKQAFPFNPSVIVIGNGQGMNRGIQPSTIVADGIPFNPSQEHELESGLTGVQTGQQTPDNFIQKASTIALNNNNQFLAKGIQTANQPDSRLYQMTPEAQQKQHERSKTLQVDDSKEMSL